MTKRDEDEFDDILDTAARALIPRLNTLSYLTAELPAAKPANPRRPCFACQATTAGAPTIVIIDALEPHQSHQCGFTLCKTHRRHLLDQWHKLGRRLTLFGFPVLAIDPYVLPDNTLPPPRSK